MQTWRGVRITCSCSDSPKLLSASANTNISPPPAHLFHLPVLAYSQQGLGNILSMYGQAGQLLYQHDVRSNRRREYVYLNGSLVAERSRPLTATTATITYQHTDALGTPVLKTSASRVVLERREYEPYGKLLNQPLESGPGYTGHDTDPATQYTYMQQRYYDPRVGRFWSVDPVTAYGTGDMRLFNRYAYAANSPYTFTDPDGRIFDTIADVGFIAYSAYVLAKDPSWTNAAALGALAPLFRSRQDWGQAFVLQHTRTKLLT